MNLHAPVQIGVTQKMTDEGYLLCEAVPIARTGALTYASHEIGGGAHGLTPDDRGLIVTERQEADVFDETTLASFNGKSVTDGHPPTLLNSENCGQFERGVVANARRGQGLQSDLVVADILVKDKALIRDIQAGRREVSVGMNSDFQPIAPGRARQHNMRGNHLALVSWGGKGRAGVRCAIGDEDMTEAALEKVAGGKPSGILDVIKKALGASTTDEAKALIEQHEASATMDEKIASAVTAATAASETRIMAAIAALMPKTATKDEAETTAVKAAYAAAAPHFAVLAPTVTAPTFDDASTLDALNAAKVKALEVAGATDKGALAIKPFVPGKPADLKGATLDAAFIGAAAMMGGMNNGDLSGLMVGPETVQMFSSQHERSRLAQEASDKRWGRSAA